MRAAEIQQLDTILRAYVPANYAKHITMWRKHLTDATHLPVVICDCIASYACTVPWRVDQVLLRDNLSEFEKCMNECPLFT